MPLFIRSLSTMAILSVLIPAVAQAAPDRAALRKLAQVPAIDINIDFGFNRAVLRSGLYDPQEIAEEAQRLEKELASVKKIDLKIATKLVQEGDLLVALKQDLPATNCYVAALSYLKPALASLPTQPASVPTLLLYGRVLQGIDQDAEAEPPLRRAVKLAPQNAEAWNLLGDTLMRRAMSVLMRGSKPTSKPTGKPNAKNPRPGTKETDTNPFPTAEQFKQLKNQKETLSRVGTLLEEANRAYDRAVEVAPQNPQPYIERAVYRAFGKPLASTLYDAARKGDDPTPLVQSTVGDMMRTGTQPEILRDFASAARLAGNNSSFVFWYLLAEMFHYLIEHPQNGPTPAQVTAEKIRPEARTDFSREFQHLTKLSQSRERSTQISASVALATLRFISGQTTEAEQLSRQLAQTAPERVRPYQILSAIYAQTRNFDKMVSLFQNRIKRRDSVEDRLVLARIYFNMNRWDALESSVQAGLKLQPRSMRAIAAQVGCLLHKGDEASLKQAGKILDNNRPRLDKEPVDPNTALAFMLNQALYLGLTNHIKEAKSLLQQIQSQVPGQPDAAAMMQAISG